MDLKIRPATLSALASPVAAEALAPALSAFFTRS